MSWQWRPVPKGLKIEPDSSSDNGDDQKTGEMIQ